MYRTTTTNSGLDGKFQNFGDALKTKKVAPTVNLLFLALSSYPITLIRVESATYKTVNSEYDCGAMSGAESKHAEKFSYSSIVVHFSDYRATHTTEGKDSGIFARPRAHLPHSLTTV